MRQKLTLILGLLLLLASCSPLKKSQVQATEKFALATKGISRIPSDIYFRIYLLKAESQNLQVNTILATNDLASESIQLLKTDYAERLRFMQLAEEYSTAYKIVEEYAALVLSLLRPDYLDEFKKSRILWMAGFDKLVKNYNAVSITKMPSSVSRFTTEVVQAIGKISFGALQKKYLRQAIHTARIPFENICQDFITIDSLKISSELKNLPSHLDNNYANFLENIRAYEKQGNNPYYYFSAYTPIYTNWLTQVGEIQVLSTETVTAFRQLKSTFAVLEAYIDGNGKSSDVPEIDLLMEQYEVLAKTYSTFENRRQKLSAAGLLK